MAEKIKPINLLPQKVSYTDQFMRWALTIGRLLIILTETLALGTFLYRFSIDMKIIDLHDAIKSEKIIVSQFQKTEETARNFQSRLAMAQAHAKEGAATSTVFADIIDLGKNKITFRNVVITANKVKIEAQASTSFSLNAFVNSLKNYPQITSVRIESVENRTSASAVVMSIKATLKGAPAASSANAEAPAQPNP